MGLFMVGVPRRSVRSVIEKGQQWTILGFHNV